MSDFTFRNALPEDYDELCKLCDERYGDGYFSWETYDHYSTRPELFITAHCGEELAGFSVMIPASKEEIAKEMKMPQEDVDELSGDKPPIIFRSLIIHKRFEKKGLPLTMANILLERVQAAGYGTIFGPAWMYDGKIPIEGLLKRLGFTQLYIRKNVWYDDLKYHCIICGGRCKCDAMIYYKKLSEMKGEG